MNTTLIAGVLKHRDNRKPWNVKMDPMEDCYFTMISKRTWRQAKSMAAKVAEISAGANSKYFIKNSGAVGKAGEMIFERYLAEYCDLNWSAPYKIIHMASGDVCDFKISGLKIDVKTRTMRPADPEALYGNYDRTVHLDRFPMMVSEGELDKAQDIYVCCGYNVESREGYVLGWATYDEVAAMPLNMDLKYPARCIPIGDLHPIQTLFAYINSYKES